MSSKKTPSRSQSGSKPKKGSKIVGANTRFRSSMSESSRKYLLRQAKDQYTSQARSSGYRSRAAFKLVHIQNKHRLIKPGNTVVDLGAAPGGWCQVVMDIFHNATPSQGKLIAMDILHMDPMSGVEVIRGDFTKDSVQERLEESVGDKKVDVVLSDMAPNTIGSRSADHLRIMQLVELAAEFALKHLRPGGNFVCKIFMGGEELPFREMLRQHFDKVVFEKPDSSRKDSREIFIVALGRKKI